MYLIVNLDSQPDRLATMTATLPGPAERFAGTAGSIPDTYRRLVSSALDNTWDLDTIVCQDDVRFVKPLTQHPIYRGSKLGRFDPPELIVYGTMRHGEHICPKAFAATPRGWKELAEVWDGQSQTCRAWRPVVELGVVLNVTEDSGGVGRHAPCRGCGH